MYDDKSLDVPCYAVRLFRPFVALFLAELNARDPDERIPMSVAHALLDFITKYLDDPDLGLKAGRAVTPGEAGALYYAVGSAPTVRKAFEAQARYIRLVNDGLDIRTEIEGTRAIIRLDSKVVLPRAAEDFVVSAVYTSHAGTMLRSIPGLEFWFARAAPDNTTEYERTFAPATVRFAAPCCGIVFDKDYLEAPLERADPKLHDVIREHAELMLAELPKARSVTEQVRTLITNELSQGHPTAARVARLLRMSPRTLGRRLEEEGTTFTALLDDLRRRLAFRYLSSKELALSEVAFLLGFSHSAAFHRAFKRWTDRTPLEYRRENQL